MTEEETSLRYIKGVADHARAVAKCYVGEGVEKQRERTLSMVNKYMNQLINRGNITKFEVSDRDDGTIDIKAVVPFQLNKITVTFDIKDINPLSKLPKMFDYI